MINFKVGDRVKVSNWYDPEEAGIVTDVEGQLYRVEYEDEEYIHAEAMSLSLAPEPTPSFKGVYVVSHGAYDGGGILGVYATRNDAEIAMTAWAERENAEDERTLRNFPDPDYEPRPYLASVDDSGCLLFEGGSGNTLYIDLIELGAPCMWSWDRDRAVKHG